MRTIDELIQETENRNREKEAKKGGGGSLMSANEWARLLFPCPLCNQLTAVKTDKNGNPYLICNDCGVQLFVRYKTGQALLLKKLVGKGRVMGAPVPPFAVDAVKGARIVRRYCPGG